MKTSKPCPICGENMVCMQADIFPDVVYTWECVYTIDLYAVACGHVEDLTDVEKVTMTLIGTL